MLIFTHKTEMAADAASAELALTHEQRRRTRARLNLKDGTEIGLALPRGTVLQPGDCIATSTGEEARILAAHEHVLHVQVNGPLHLARLAYHLGNRHATLQFTESSLLIPFDPVLQDLCVRLGAEVFEEWRPFDPELLSQIHHGESGRMPASAH